LNTGYPIENSPLIAGDSGFAQNNAMQVIAFDLKTGLSKWKYDPGYADVGAIPRATNAHGMIYEDGVLYADTGPNATVIAFNASDGSKIWESEPLLTQRELQAGSYRVQSPVTIWNDIVIVGNSLGDSPPFGFPARGFLSALDKETGKELWRTYTAVGAWVEGNNTSMNGGATPWTIGAVDNETGVIYVPCGNAAPDFSAETRPLPNNWAYHMLAINITDGKILWETPFIAEGSVFVKALNLTIPDTHDWDPDFGSNLLAMNINGTMQRSS
jgi:alcohol dehydrogenase (cytochrome c)